MLSARWHQIQGGLGALFNLPTRRAQHVSLAIAHRRSSPRHLPSTLEKRPAFWTFERLDTFRPGIIQRAGRLIRPQGQLILSMSVNPTVQEELLHYLRALQAA